MNTNIKCLLCAEYYDRHWDYGNEDSLSSWNLQPNEEHRKSLINFKRVGDVNREKVKGVMRAFDGTFSKPRKDWVSFPRKDYSYETSEMSKGELVKGE